MISIQRAETPDDIDAVCMLVPGFVRWTTAEIAATDNPAIVVGLENELAGLPERYGPPTGSLVLARLNGKPSAAAGFRRARMALALDAEASTTDARSE